MLKSIAPYTKLLAGAVLVLWIACDNKNKNQSNDNKPPQGKEEFVDEKEVSEEAIEQLSGVQEGENPLLGLPPLPVPKDNPITKEKVQLGETLFHDVRFSSDQAVSCATCHAVDKGFSDALAVSVGIDQLAGTRNSPTIINSAFNHTQFWDGRSASLEDQAQHPFVNPVEMGLKDHSPILKVVQTDEAYMAQFKRAFNVAPKEITMDHVLKAIATFERTVIAGNSRFDRWYYLGEPSLTEKEIKGFNVFMNQGRCVSCHSIEHTSALFTDHKFHNIGVGINNLATADLNRLVTEFLEADYNEAEVDLRVLQDPKSSELGRFAITQDMSQIGAFKTPTLRNIDLTAPYMHDGSLVTLEEVVLHYNRGGASSDEEEISPLISGGIRPLELSDEQIDQLVAFMKALTSKEFLTGKDE